MPSSCSPAVFIAAQSIDPPLPEPDVAPGGGVPFELEVWVGAPPPHAATNARANARLAILVFMGKILFGAALRARWRERTISPAQARAGTARLTNRRSADALLGMNRPIAIEQDILDWLLDSDPAVRWQVLRDLGGAPAETVAAERARVATEGLGGALIALQSPNGTWPPHPENPGWQASPEGTAFTALLWLKELGLDPASPEARQAVGRVRDQVTWHWWDDHAFFVGEVEPCINSRVVALGAYFGEEVTGLVERLLGEQMADGGWNCEQERGSTRGSFNTTINVLEGLLEHERATGGSAESAAARARAHEYLLERRLLRRRSTGEIVDAEFSLSSFPTDYNYDVLRALDYFRDAGVADARMAEAIDAIQAKRGPDGRWPLDRRNPTHIDFDLGETPGEPSRWITLRALRVLGQLPDAT